MPYGSEGLKPIGFASAGATQPGFAAGLRTAKKIDIPQIGMFADLARFEATEAARGRRASGQKLAPEDKPTPRVRRSSAPKKQGNLHPWPEMFIGQKLDMRDKKAWEQYTDKVHHDSRDIGRAIEPAELCLVIISSKELHSAMNERYEGTARKNNPMAQKSRAREVANSINKVLLRQLREEEYRESIARELAEDPRLLERALDPDYSLAWELELAREVADGSHELQQAPIMPLWTAASYEVGAQEGIGERGIGLSLRNTMLYSRRAKLTEKLCSPQGLNFGADHFRGGASPVVQLLDTVMPANGLKYSLPERGRPSEFPAQSPRLYMPNM